ncbi:OsmC family peroxiredoxin [Microbacterium sp. NPDC058389]|uniref:OsmC family peroxiredoxin n=1 Tax=Microbacterium sp. NPDC058389 TaxID=3346475 RepID=UPI003650FC65
MTLLSQPEYGGGRVVEGFSTWEGTFRKGHGAISTGSPVLTDAPYTYASRFEGATGASPEELLAAAHAACFNHALANISELRGETVHRVTTSAYVEMGRDSAGPAILGIHLTVKANVAEATKPHFADLVERARVGCAFSKALRVEVTVTAEHN